jgi:subtilisin family serine protease
MRQPRGLVRAGRRSLAAERLETRRLLAADLVDGIHHVVWNGETVASSADSWIVTTAGSAPRVNAGWSSRSLGEGMFAVRAPGASAADVATWATGVGARGIEPDRIITSAALPGDPSFGSLWGLDNSGQTGGVADADIDAPEAWNVTTGSRSVVVGVVDTGVDYRHPDLAANMWRNPGEVAGDRIDNDGNGFVDDVYGWDFANNDADPFDDNGHGTHTSGTIGAVGGNGAGVAGVNWQVSLMALKFLGADGSGTTSAAVAALNYATMMRRTYGVNVVATNNSWGGGGASTALTNAIVAGGNAGILCVAAAGNESSNNDAIASYPANVNSSAVIAVAATDSSNRLASFSNYGVTTVDVAAPGVGILSTTPNGTYSSYSGTSMATPHVAGMVALLAAANPQATATQIRSAILSTAVPVGSLAGKVATGGLANAAAAVAAIGGGGGGTTPTKPAPTADVIDVAPDPRTTAVSGIVLQFSRAVSGVDAADLTLRCDGTAVSLAGVTVTTTDGIRWTVDGLDVATASAGTYVLTVNAAGSGIRATDDAQSLAVSASDTWVTQAATLVDAGDTIAAAATVGITSGEIRLSGRVGDGSFGSKDVDLYKVVLAAGQTLTIDVDARTLSGGSTLDSYVRVFNSSGRQQAANDDDGLTYDSLLTVRASSAGTFYVGLSGYGNTGYSPTRAGSGRAGSTGVYQVRFAFSPLATATLGARTAGSRDSTPAATSAAEAAFAAYGANWMAALPAEGAAGVRSRRQIG